MSETQKHVVIVGGGFAGLGCAQKLVKHDNVKVTLIDKHNYHQFTPLLYQVATAELSPEDVAAAFRNVFNAKKNIDIKMAEVVSVDPKTKTVKTKTGESYSGDYLVLSAGSVVNFFDTKGADVNTFPMYQLDDAERLRSRILGLFEEADRDQSLIEKGALNFVIVGAGPTGTELAGALADMVDTVLPNEFTDLNIKSARIYLVDYNHAVLRQFSKKSQNYAANVLQQRGVQLKLGLGVKEVDSSRVTLADGTKILSRTVIWAGGNKAAQLAANTGLKCGRGGRLEVNPDLRVNGFEGIYSIGDFANMPSADGKTLPQLASCAQQSGHWAANNILNEMAGKPTTPFEYNDKGIMAMIGRNAAVAELGKSRHQLEGVVAFAAWLGVHAALMSTIRQKINAFIEWAWDYFAKRREVEIIDREEAARIDWNK